MKANRLIDAFYMLFIIKEIATRRNYIFSSERAKMVQNSL